MQSQQVSVQQAVADAPQTATRLLELATAHEGDHRELNSSETVCHWEEAAGTRCYQTHIAISDQSEQRFQWFTDVLFKAPGLDRQPWYPQFCGGVIEPCTLPVQGDIGAHVLAVGSFDLGMKSPRCYRQLVSLQQVDDHTAVILARSVLTGPALPETAKLAFTLAPNGEVLRWHDGCLHWHHICCTPGAALLPGVLDRWFINSLRGVGLDGSERETYRSEAEQLRDWLQTDAPELAL